MPVAADSRGDMVATNGATRKAGGPRTDASEDGTPELTAADAAARMGHLFPEVYRRYHYAQRLHQGADLPVTRRALGVLQHLAASGPHTVGEQAVHLGLRRNSVSELLQRLELKGLVARVRDERDERRVLVWLTDQGREVVARVGEVLAADLLRDAMVVLSPGERATVVRGFELLAGLQPVEPTSLPRKGHSHERAHP
ncbi:MAG: MarR family winged helix-turn-helix transcriptional regulator [Candidatus Limnocylindrales bacterium]